MGMLQFTSEYWSAKANIDMDMLERYRTGNGTYLFPANLLQEHANSHFLYSGAHMGLAENRRGKQGLALESTFRALRIQRQMRASVLAPASGIIYNQGN
jgi:hypothetical protein